MECLSYCIANTIDLTKLDNYFKENLANYTSAKSRDVLKLYGQASSNVIFIFKNGTVVSWGLKRYQIHNYLALIKPFADKPIPMFLHDEFSYQSGEIVSIKPHEFFDVDCLIIDEDSDDLKLSFSYGFSQSVKLQYFETTIDSLIEKYSPMMKALSVKGKMPISRKEIRKVIGEILGAKSEMNLISNFLYHPKYFWQHPTLEENYILLERYLHIPRRVNAINHRLDTLNEIFDMFNRYLENKHAHILEVIIIILITIEIVFFVLNFHF